MKQKHKIPEGWREIELGRVARFINGRAFKPNEWESQGRLIIRIQDLTGSIDNPNYTNKEFDKKYLVKEGDLLISWSATLDAFLWNKEEGWLNQHIFKVEEDKEILNHKYLFYFVKKSIDLFKRDTHGSTMKHITKGNFDRIKIPLPPIETQKEIVAILEKAEALKRKREEADKLTQEYLKSVFAEMFLGKGFEEVELGNKRHFEIIMGQSPPGNSYNEDGRGIAFFQGKAEFTDKYPIVKKWTTKPSKFAEPGSILMSVRAPVGDINLCNVKCSIGRGLASIKPTDAVDLSYIYYFLSSHKENIAKLGTGSTFHAITSKQLYSIKIPLPPLELQQKFASIVEHVEGLKEKQKKSKEHIGEMFEVLMQKAFNGELVR